MRTSRCDACGGNAQPLPLEDGDALATLARGEASPLAREAWSRRDWASFVSHALTVEGVTDVRSTRLADGPGFSAVVRGVATLVAVRQNAQQIVLEAPVARLPQTMIVPALRILLEASHDASNGARFAVRDDLVVVRVVGRLDQDTPIAFGTALRGLVGAANEMADRLVASVDARMLAPSEHQALDFDTMPAGRFLGRIAHAPQAATPAPTAAAASRRPQVSPFRQGGSSAVTSAGHAAITAPPGGTPTTAPQAPTAPPAGRATKPPGRASGAFEALLAPAPPPQHLPTPQAPEPFSTPGDEVPAILSAGHPHPGSAGHPHPGSPRPDPAKSPRPAPAASAPLPESGPGRPAPNIAKTVEVPIGPALKPPPRGPSMRPTPIAVPTIASPKTPPVADRPTTGNAPTVQTAKAVEPPARQADLMATQVSMAPPPPGPKALCDLLHKAQTLGAVLSFADQPATMLLLVRATVYRGVFEFGEGAPGAVAELFERTRELTKEIHITAPGKRRGTMAIPQAETAFDIFGEIVAANGVRPAAGPPAIEPITTAQDAKQHLARYVSEIDQAPADIEVRHFLGIGALCELVVRTKLPPQTLDRVRGIIGRALKEGPRQSSIELMMTALNRIIGG
jgi:hypothetical protein